MDCTTQSMVEVVHSALVSVANLDQTHSQYNLSISLSETLNCPVTEVITTSLASNVLSLTAC